MFELFLKLWGSKAGTYSQSSKLPRAANFGPLSGLLCATFCRALGSPQLKEVFNN